MEHRYGTVPSEGCSTCTDLCMGMAYQRAKNVVGCIQRGLCYRAASKVINVHDSFSVADQFAIIAKREPLFFQQLPLALHIWRFNPLRLNTRVLQSTNSMKVRQT